MVAPQEANMRMRFWLKVIGAAKENFTPSHAQAAIIAAKRIMTIRTLAAGPAERVAAMTPPASRAATMSTPMKTARKNRPSSR